MQKRFSGIIFIATAIEVAIRYRCRASAFNIITILPYFRTCFPSLKFSPYIVVIGNLFFVVFLYYEEPTVIENKTRNDPRLRHF